jgi:hypothetical protein
MESNGFTCNFFLLIFTFLDFLYLKNEFGATKMSVEKRCRSCRPVVFRNLCRRYLSRLEGYIFEISATLHQMSWIDAPHTQNFEILKSLEQT